MEKNGLLIAIEGVDHSGTSTQTRMLHDNIKRYSQYQDVITTHEPWKSKDIRRELMENPNIRKEGAKMSDLYLSDRVNHQLNLISPNINNGSIIITDRHAYSHFVYQSVQEVTLDYIHSSHHKREIILPNLTFFLDVGLEEIVNRTKNSGKQLDEFEKNIAFTKKIINRYEMLSNPKYSYMLGEIIRIDGERKEKSIANEIFKIFIERFGERIDTGKY